MHRSRSQSPEPKRGRSSISFNAKSYWSELTRKRKIFEKERNSLSIYTAPHKVFGYFLLSSIEQISRVHHLLLENKIILSAIVLSVSIFYTSLYYDGPHLLLLNILKQEIKYYGYWLLLGIASSIGLGTGLHTFVLFLGPHVAEVTMAAYECGSLNFSIRGEDKLLCTPGMYPSEVTPLMILLKVLPQSVIWGFGTALGELPPYFMARAAAYAGKGNSELEELDKISKKDPSKLTYKQRLLLTIYQLLQITGFLGIFICASIPNPLFDLAGITCGHFLIPFTTFFSAVVLGKAFVKSSLQVFIIILLFSKDVIQKVLEFIRPRIPFLYSILDRMIQEQTNAIRSGGSPSQDPSEEGGSIISLLWNSLIALMMLYFLFSIIESIALSYLQRTQESELTKLERRPTRHKHSRSNSVYF